MSLVSSFQRVSETSEGISSRSSSFKEVGFSPNGEKVIFQTSPTLFNQTSYGRSEFYVKNIENGELTRIETNSDGTPYEEDSDYSRILRAIFSQDGNKLAFEYDSRSTPNEIVVKDLISGENFIASNGVDSEQHISKALPSFPVNQTNLTFSAYDTISSEYDIFQVNFDADEPLTTQLDIDAFGNDFTMANRVYFTSSNGDLLFSSPWQLTNDDTNNFTDMYLFNPDSKNITLISNSDSGVAADRSSSNSNISFSADGEKVAFLSSATNLISGKDSVPSTNLYVKDIRTGKVTRILTDSEGNDTENLGHLPAVFSPDGKYVLFSSTASDLTDNDTNDFEDVFIKNLETNETTRLSESENGEQGNGRSYIRHFNWNDTNQLNTYFTADSSKVIFRSDASNLVEGDNNLAGDLFMKDIESGKIVRLTDTDGTEFEFGVDIDFRLSSDGTKLLFSTKSSLVENDDNNAQDLYVAEIDLSAFGPTPVLFDGTDASEVIIGDELNDTLNGNAGNDTINGLMGDDVLNGGTGDDVFTDVQGSNTIDGGEGRDLVDFSAATQGADIDLANPTKNKGAALNNSIINVENVAGTEFNDTIKGDNADNSVVGNAGDDILLGRGGEDTLEGSDGNDRIYGQGGNDFMRGGAGDDTIDGGRGNNTFIGGDGNDIFVIGLDAGTTDFISDFDKGTNIIDLTAFINYNGGFEGLVFESFGPDPMRIGLPEGQQIFLDNVAPEDFSAEDFLFYVDPNAGLGDSIEGTDADESFAGTEFDDVIFGAGGNDTFFASAGFDRLDGGNGRDLLNYLDVDEYIKIDLLNQTENKGAALGDVFTDIEIFSGGNNNDQLKGDNVDNEIVGGDGNDLILGRAGNDSLYGNNGNDTIYGQNGDDVIYGSHSFFGGNDVLHGGAGNDDIYGGLGEDTLNGGVGEDTLTGGADEMDIFAFYSINDSHENTGIDIITDYEIYVDKIDVSALGFTAFSYNSYTQANEVRVFDDIENFQTRIINDQTGFELIIEGDVSADISANDFIFA